MQLSLNNSFAWIHKECVVFNINAFFIISCIRFNCKRHVLSVSYQIIIIALCTQYNNKEFHIIWLSSQKFLFILIIWHDNLKLICHITIYFKSKSMWLSINILHNKLIHIINRTTLSHNIKL